MKRGWLTCLVAMAMPVAVVLPAAASAASHVAPVSCTQVTSRVRELTPPRHGEHVGSVAERRVGRHRRATERECRSGRGDEDHYHAAVGEHRQSAAGGPCAPSPTPPR
jgi:hypothetical protein